MRAANDRVRGVRSRDGACGALDGSALMPSGVMHLPTDTGRRHAVGRGRIYHRTVIAGHLDGRNPVIRELGSSGRWARPVGHLSHPGRPAPDPPDGSTS